jgi:small subunit ribosomal protein S16
MGQKKRPFYRIIAADNDSPRDGRFLERLGTYNPLQDPAQVNLNAERVKYWIGRGAVPTDTVKSILKREGIFTADN